MKVTNEKLKKILFDLSGEQLITNRKECVYKIRSIPDYRGDIKSTNGEQRYSICRGILDMDGTGNTRAYNHIIRGSQHSLIACSLLIMKNILVVSHLTS